MNYGLFFAILSPLLYAGMNIVDKFIIDKKVKNIYSYIPVAGLATIVYVSIFAVFLSWSSISFHDLILPVVCGFVWFIQFFLYVLLLQRQDVSNSIGLMYIYPLFVAILSFFILKEVVSFMGYVGVFLVIIGALLLSLKFNKKEFKTSIFLVLVLAVFVAINEFLIKIVTNSISPYNGMVIYSFVFGIFTFVVLFHTKTRKGFVGELKNIRFVFLSEFFSCAGAVTLFIAMSKMPATIVSAIAAVQPLFILFLEYLTNKFIINISKDNRLIHKLIPISLIVAGIILLSLTQI